MALSARFIPAITICVALVSALFTGVDAGKKPFVDAESFEFRLPDLDGNMVSSADPRFEGKVLFVTLWATWCAPCITEIPTFIEFQEQYGDSGLVIVAIAFEAPAEADKRRERLRSFVEQRGINYLVVDGGPPKLLKTALPTVKNVKGLPVEIVVDRKGKVSDTRNGYGYKEKWVKELKKEIETLLKEAAN